jgi:hypothetical protein
MSNIMQKLSAPMMAVLSKLTPSCKEVSRLISDSLERPLSTREKLGVKIHLWGCDLCKRYRDQLIMLQKVFEKYSISFNSEDLLGGTKLRPEAKDKIRKLLHEEQS